MMDTRWNSRRCLNVFQENRRPCGQVFWGFFGTPTVSFKSFGVILETWQEKVEEKHALSLLLPVTYFMSGYLVSNIVKEKCLELLLCCKK